MKCEICSKEISPDEAFVCEYCGKHYCTSCACNMGICDCAGDFKRYS